MHYLPRTIYLLYISMQLCYFMLPLHISTMLIFLFFCSQFTNLQKKIIRCEWLKLCSTISKIIRRAFKKIENEIYIQQQVNHTLYIFYFLLAHFNNGLLQLESCHLHYGNL